MRSPDPKSATILLVDDHEDSRDAFGLILTSLGHRVVLAQDGIDGLKHLETVLPDLILCDLNMPGMDGFSFIAALRSRPALADVTVLAMTGRDSPVETLRTAGFAGHLAKPIDYDAMVDALDRFLGARGKA
jgi:CheY-like chemotaxis protein